MADLLPVEVPEDYTRALNRSHTGEINAIPDERLFSYGTAGFRENADVLPFIVYRVGYLAGLRARHLNKSIGVMITASHNPENDNGVKIIDPEGEMLTGEWEKYATELINTSDEQLPTAVRALEVQLAPSNCSSARVVCAMDTRISGPRLMEAAKAGASLLEVEFHSHGVLTTPQLHYIVRTENDPSFGPNGELGYYTFIGDAFTELFELTPLIGDYSPVLHLDCANGVGAKKMRILHRFLPERALKIDFLNENGVLNHQCGADFVKISCKFPDGFENIPTGEKCAVFDGDADRLVYFYRRNDGGLELLDGDKIALLLSKFLQEQLSALGLLSSLSMAVVQTAYANGSSSDYIRKHLGLSPVFVPTGVKHLHHEAVNHDVGVYFEANGHGTVVFSQKFKDEIKKVEGTEAGKRIALLSRVINETVGDAMADLLAVEIVLRHYGWSVEKWASLYRDAPSRQIKVPVNDRSAFTTTHDETRLTKPAPLQMKIDELVQSSGEGARAFVRPSGTENIVRVYAEAAGSEEAQALAEAVHKAVLEYAL